MAQQQSAELIEPAVGGVPQSICAYNTVSYVRARIVPACCPSSRTPWSCHCRQQLSGKGYSSEGNYNFAPVWRIHRTPSKQARFVAQCHSRTAFLHLCSGKHGSINSGSSYTSCFCRFFVLGAHQSLLLNAPFVDLHHRASLPALFLLPLPRPRLVPSPSPQRSRSLCLYEAPKLKLEPNVRKTIRYPVFASPSRCFRNRSCALTAPHREHSPTRRSPNLVNTCSTNWCRPRCSNQQRLP